MTGPKLTAAREALHMTRGAFAVEVGVDPKTLRKYEASPRHIPEKVRNSVAHALAKRAAEIRAEADAIEGMAGEKA